jgi:ergothioneine biosynthesis protein EgtB
MIIENYKIVRNHTTNICTPLETEDYIPQPVEFVSPPKWHLAHTTWFFEQMILKKFKSNYKEFHKDFSFLFNSYYNTVGTRTLRADRGNMTRPTVKEVFAYREYVDQAMLELLNSNSSDDLKELVILGLNHEQQHQELLITDLKYTLGHNPLFPVYDKENNFSFVRNKESGWLKVEEGVYEVGFEGEGFHFDNELGRHKTYIHEFEISKSLITNAEYIEFIEAEAYSTFSYWLDEGWHWVKNNKINSPLYWHKIDGEWWQYTLAGLQKIDPNAILAHISFYEANAFANWKGMRLPTEFEWEVVADNLDWGTRWEWTNSAYLPYPKFKTKEGAVGEYNGKFMINTMVLRGRSVATPEGHSRNTYRNFFHPNFQWQFTGIRLAK